MLGVIFSESTFWEHYLSKPTSTPSLREAFVNAYPVYVARVVNDRGIEMNEVLADAVVEGVAVLDALMASFEQTSFDDQRVSPLELFGEALRPIDRAFALTGVEESNDADSIHIASWDRYTLSPGSSEVLGPDAHEAHLRWALRKAQAVAPAVLGRPVAFVHAVGSLAEDVRAAVALVGYRVVDEYSTEAVIAVIDASSPAVGGLVSKASTENTRAIVFGTEIDDLMVVGLRALGADSVITVEELVYDPATVLPTII
jgi:hypothetical protein